MFLSFHSKIVLGKQKKKNWCRSGFPLLLSSVLNFDSLQIGMGVKINFLKAIEHYCAIIQYF